jgi:hypothetical protein
VLKESHLEPFIRHAVTALGALTKTYFGSQPRVGDNAIASAAAQRRYHQFALRQYNKAIVAKITVPKNVEEFPFF